MDKGTGKLRAGNGWGVSLTVLLVLLLGLGRKMWSAAAEEAGGHFCIKRRRRDLELCVSQET